MTIPHGERTLDSWPVPAQNTRARDQIAAIEAALHRLSRNPQLSDAKYSRT